MIARHQSPRDLVKADRARAPRWAGLCVIVGTLCAFSLSAADQAAFRQLMAQGSRFQSTGNLRAASAKYNAATDAATTDEERAEALIAHANVLRSLDRDDQAEEQLQRAVALEQVSAHLRRAAISQLATLLEDHDRIDEAVELYRRLAEAIMESPDQSAGALLSAAQLLYDAERYREAREVLRKVPQDGLPRHQRLQAANLLIDVLIELGDIDAVQSAVDGAGLPQTDAAYLQVRLARVLLQQDRTEEAAAACEAAMKADPANQLVWRTRYDIAESQGNVEELKARFTAQLAANPTDALAIERLASLAEWSSDPEGALTVYRKLVELHPDDPAVLERAGSLAATAGQNREALKLYEAALRLDPDDMGLQYVIGDVYAKVGDTAAAIEAWKRGTGFKPEDVQAAQRLGSLLAQRGLYAEAVGIYETCRERRGDRTVLAAEMAQALTALLRPSEALAEYVMAASTSLEYAELVAADAARLAQDSELSDELVSRARTGLRTTGAPGLALLLVMVEAKSGRAGEAVEALTAADLRPSDLMSIGECLEVEGLRDAAARLYAAVAASEAASPGLRLEMGLRAAEVDAAAGRREQAAALLREVTSTEAGPDQLRDRALLLLADLDLSAGRDIEQARDVFASLAAGSMLPEVAEEARWRLADCAFAAGEFDRAAGLYEQLAQQPPTEEIALPPAPPGFHLPMQRLALPHMILEMQPADPRMTPAYAHSQIAECAFRSGDLERAKALFAEVAENYPQSIYANDAVERRAFIATHFARPRPATETYLQALAGGSGSEWQQSVARLDEIAATREAESLADDAALLAATLLDVHGRHDEAADRFRAIPEQHPSSLLAPEALLNAARIARMLADERQAREDLEAIAQNFPDAPMAKTAALWLDDLRHGRSWTHNAKAP
jgi:tetratricopeptide (TPR) repeat protein